MKNTTERPNNAQSKEQNFVSITFCEHPYLKTDKKTRNKICTSCGAVIYRVDRFMPVYLSIPKL
ncbi:MAG: hypothetical protein ACXVC6_09950 [Bacteroidia bacterium]